jgi:hypothetical protein
MKLANFGVWECQDQATICFMCDHESPLAFSQLALGCACIRRWHTHPSARFEAHCWVTRPTRASSQATPSNHRREISHLLRNEWRSHEITPLRFVEVSFAWRSTILESKCVLFQVILHIVCFEQVRLQKIFSCNFQMSGLNNRAG